jgi:hypothetical protein
MKTGLISTGEVKGAHLETNFDQVIVNSLLDELPVKDK